MSETPAFFVADSPGLDFLNTIATPVDTPFEWIDSGEGLLSWLGQANLVEQPVLDDIRRTALPGELDSIAVQARALREWFRTFVERHRGAPLTDKALDELEPVNRILARDEQYIQIARRGGEPGETPFVLKRLRRWRTAESLLLPLAEVMAEMIADDDFRNVKACEGHSCTLLFVDRTRRRARRWCSMAVCGNRAKQAAHRERVTAARR